MPVEKWMAGWLAGGCFVDDALVSLTQEELISSKQKPANSSIGEPPSFWSSSPTPATHRDLGPLHEPAPKRSEPTREVVESGSLEDASWGAWRLLQALVAATAKVPGEQWCAKTCILTGPSCTRAREARGMLGSPGWNFERKTQETPPPGPP